MIKFFLFVVLYLEVSLQGQPGDSKVGKTQDKLLLLDNYIPAAMQVIFYLTDCFKYELRPVTSGLTTTTIRPTPPHRPGNYAPEQPPGPAAYFAKSSLRNSWGASPENSREGQFPGGLGIPDGSLDGGSYNGDFFKSPWTSSSENFGGFRAPGVPGEGLEDEGFTGQFHRGNIPEDLDLLGAGPSELLLQINSLGDFDTVGDEDDDVLRFSLNYDDNVNVDFLRQKRTPPTRAYVTLLSLYDLLNKEAKEKGLNKYNGYADKILKELSSTSHGTSEEQLKFVLSKVLEAKNTRKANIVKKIKLLLEDLEKPDSYINDSLKYVPPLQFVL